jgi:hypothetical protein
VIDPQTQAILHEIVRRESRSLLSYVADAYPWTTAAGGPALVTLRQAIDAETEAVATLGRYMVRHKAPLTFLGSYPAHFTSINFVALEYLLPRLVAAQKESIAALESDLRQIERGEVRTQVEALLAVKRQTLATLEGLSVPRAPALASA